VRRHSLLILWGWGLFSAYDVNVSSQQDLQPRRKSKYELGYLFPVYTHTIRILIYVLFEVSQFMGRKYFKEAVRGNLCGLL
jgi:hypothetical protein